MPTQGSEPNAKDDTLYYGRNGGAGIADLATDLSQYGDNQTTGAGFHYEPSPATRFNVTTSWCIELDCTMTNASTGYLFSYPNLALSLNGAGSVEVRLNGLFPSTIALPGVGAGAERFVVVWAAAPNPYTTGASDAVRTDVRLYNVTDGSYTQFIGAHAVRTAGTGNAVFWANTIAPTNVFSGTPNACRFSTGRPRTTTETYEDFIAMTSAPTLTLATRCEFPIVDPACALGAAGQLVGPVHYMGAHATKANAFRTLSPIVNAHYLNRPELVGSTFATLPTQWLRAAPDTAFTMMGSFLFYRPVPPSANRLRARVFVKEWLSGAGPLSNLIFRIYSMNRPPVSMAVIDQDAAFVSTFCEATLTATNHGSAGTNGEWLDLGIWSPSLNSDGCTWLALAVDVSGGTAADTRFEIGAVVIEPGVLE